MTEDKMVRRKMQCSFNLFTSADEPDFFNLQPISLCLMVWSRVCTLAILVLSIAMLNESDLPR